ncbi:hypothetical protein ACSS6W_002117 [Trichoderma asperelloides]
MTILSIRSLLWAFALFNAQPTTAIQAGDADALFTSWNDAFLIRSGGDVYYKAALNDNSFDGSWTGSLDILVAEDAYERTGDPNLRGLVYDLLNTWLEKVPPPWTWDWWNDDIGWFTLALIRGHLITGYSNFLTNAKYGYDLAYSRGWNTQYNGGGIWEQNPEGNPRELGKEALSNDSLGKVACLIYQATHDQANPSPGLNTWADEVVRGAGRFVQNYQLWDKYYPWFVQNADAIMKNRRLDIGLTANAWDQPTVGATVKQWGYNGNQNQRWQFSQNSDGTWNILSMTSFKALDCPNGETDDNLAMIQWSRNRDPNQRWVMEKQTDGSYLIQNAASGKYLDGASNSTNGASLIQWSKNGQSQQRWVLRTV